MPDPGEDYQRWSIVADNNGNIDPLIDWHEGQARRTVNNSSRSEMAAHAKNRMLNNGTIITTGSPNAQAFLSGVNYLTIPTGLRATLKIGPGLTNDGPVTLACDGTAPVEVKLPTLFSCKGSEFTSGRHVDLIYNGTFWIYLYSAGNFAPLDSPVFTGDPQAPTPLPNDADNSIATTKFVMDTVFGGTGIVLSVKVFNTPGTTVYIPHAAMKSCIVECIGGGGGGGGANSGGGADGWFVGGGGGSGGYSRKLLTGTDIGASQPVTVGAGGTGGGGGYPVPGDAGSGGATILGSVSSPLCKANGGGGGSGGSQGEMPTGGPGGYASGAVGEVVAQGAPGHTGFYHGFGQSAGAAISISSSAGGSSAFGGGAVSHSQLSGNAAGAYGSGGSGGGAVGGAGSGSGGAGSAGVIIITEFSGSGAVGPQGPIGLTGPQGPIGPIGPSGAGTGDVLRIGTPVNLQIARWTDASHIQGIDVSTITSGFAPLVSPALTGNPTAPTPTPLDADTSIATTGFVATAISAITIGATDVPTAGRLTYVSPTQLKFAPYNGHLIKIAGTLCNIANTGILGLANTGIFINNAGSSNLAANVTYLVCAFINGGVVTADFRTVVSHVTDTAAGNEGVEVFAADPSRTVIGMCRTSAAAQFVDVSQNRAVASWFNRRPRMFAGPTIAPGTGATFPIDGGGAVGFLTWGDAVPAEITGAYATQSAGFQSSYMNIGLDGIGTFIGPPVIITNTNAGIAYNGIQAGTFDVAEGYHTLTVAVGVTGGSATFGGQIQGSTFI